MIKTLTEVTKDFNLKINSKKSALLAIQNHDKLKSLTSEERYDIEIIDSYKYLGILINN